MKTFLTNETGTKKVSIYFVAGNGFPLSQYWMKSYSKKTSTDEEILFNYGLSGNRFVTENKFGIWDNRCKIFERKAT